MWKRNNVFPVYWVCMSSVYSSCLSVLCCWPAKFDSYPSNMTFIKILFHSFAPAQNRLVIFGEMITANKLHLAWQQTQKLANTT